MITLAPFSITLAANTISDVTTIYFALKFSDIKISHFFDGHLELEVTSNRALIYNDRNEIILDTTHGVSYFDDAFLRFNSKKSVFNLESNELRLIQSYLVYSNHDQFYWMNSEDILWNSLKNEVVSNTKTFIYHDQFNIETNYFLMNMITETILLDKRPLIHFALDHDKAN